MQASLRVLLWWAKSWSPRLPIEAVFALPCNAQQCHTWTIPDLVRLVRLRIRTGDLEFDGIVWRISCYLHKVFPWLGGCAARAGHSHANE